MLDQRYHPFVISLAIVKSSEVDQSFVAPALSYKPPGRFRREPAEYEEWEWKRPLDRVRNTPGPLIEPCRETLFDTRGSEVAKNLQKMHIDGGIGSKCKWGKLDCVRGYIGKQRSQLCRFRRTSNSSAKCGDSLMQDLTSDDHAKVSGEKQGKSCAELEAQGTENSPTICLRVKTR